MTFLKNTRLSVILIIAIFSFIAPSCKTTKTAESSCNSKKSMVDKCSEPSQKSECCKKK